jgi:hypothetical protein
MMHPAKQLLKHIINTDTTRVNKMEPIIGHMAECKSLVVELKSPNWLDSLGLIGTQAFPMKDLES